MCVNWDAGGGYALKSVTAHVFEISGSRKGAGRIIFFCAFKKTQSASLIPHKHSRCAVHATSVHLCRF